jgi:hypothetical protein
MQHGSTNPLLTKRTMLVLLGPPRPKKVDATIGRATPTNRHLHRSRLTRRRVTPATVDGPIARKAPRALGRLTKPETTTFGHRKTSQCPEPGQRVIYNKYNLSSKFNGIIIRINKCSTSVEHLYIQKHQFEEFNFLAALGPTLGGESAGGLFSRKEPAVLES